MIMQWVLNSHSMDAGLWIMKDLLKLNIYGNNSEGTMIIHHILSTGNPMTRSGISNVKIYLGKVKMKYFDNDVRISN